MILHVLLLPDGEVTYPTPVDGSVQVTVDDATYAEFLAGRRRLNRTTLAYDLIPEVVNGDSLKTKARQALTANQTFLAIASPTNAQTLAQVKALTRQIDALIRLAVNELGDTAGT